MIPPTNYQTEASQFIYERNHSLLFCRMGSGKTRISLMAAQDWLESGAAKRVMIVAPLRVVNHVWMQEAEKWGIPLTFRLCTGQMNKPARELALKASSDILLVNYEMLPEVLAADHGCDAIIIDEISKLRNGTSKRQKLVRKQKFKLWAGLSGTPAPNGLTSLYGMTQAVGLQHIWGEFSRNHDKWMRRFFYPADHFQRTWLPFKETAAELADLIRPYTYTLEAAAIELPPIVQMPINVSLPPKLRRKYEEMRGQSKLSDEQIIADTAGVVRMKLRQILSGFAYNSEGAAISLEDDYRLQILKDIVEEQNGQPTMIVYEFTAQLEQMKQAWPAMRWIGGGSQDDNATIDDWNAGKIEVLGIHPYAAGHGLNLQFGGCAVAFWQIPDDMESYDQVLARLARPGQRSPCVYSYEPAALGTVDQAVIAAAHGKRTTQDALWAALRR